MNLSRLNTLMAFTFATQATGLAVCIFVMCRGDHDMKLLALGAAISQTTALMSTASTMLTGRPPDSKHDPSELPAGTLQTSTETTQTPPLTIPTPEPPTTSPSTPQPGA